MADRDVLLQEINFGIKLRPTKTVDKSQPVIQAEGEKFKHYTGGGSNTIADRQQDGSMAAPPCAPPCAPPPPPPPLPPISNGTLSGRKPMTNGHCETKPSCNGQAKGKQNHQNNVDRDALLTEIRSGVKLKKVVPISDQSIPRIDNAQKINGEISPKAEKTFCLPNAAKNSTTPDNHLALMNEINQGVMLKSTQQSNGTTSSGKYLPMQSSSISPIDRPDLLQKHSSDNIINDTPFSFAEIKEKFGDNRLQNATVETPRPNKITEMRKSFSSGDSTNVSYIKTISPQIIYPSLATRKLSKEQSGLNCDENSASPVDSIPKMASVQLCSPTEVLPPAIGKILPSIAPNLNGKNEYFKESPTFNVLPVPYKPKIVHQHANVTPKNEITAEKHQMYLCKPVIVSTAVDLRVEKPSDKESDQILEYDRGHLLEYDEPKQKEPVEICIEKYQQSPDEDFAKCLKEKLDQSPQPNYPLKKPISQDENFKRLFSSALNGTASTPMPSSEIVPPNIAPPPIPSSESSSPSSPINGWLSNSNVVKTITKALERKASVDQIHNGNTLKELKEHTIKNGCDLNNSTSQIKQRKFSTGSDFILSTLHNGSVNQTAAKPTSQPREHIIEVKRIPLHSSEMGNSDRQYNSGSKTLPRRMHHTGGGGSFSEQGNNNGTATIARQQNGSDKATIRTLPLNLQNPPLYTRHNSDPNLLDSEDSGIDAEFSLFRKVFPNVSQLRNRFEDNKSDDGSSTKSSPSNPYPSQTFACKPALAIPIPPTVGSPQHLSVQTKFDDKSIRMNGKPSREPTGRRMSSASESSSYSSSDLSSPRSGGAKREYYIASSNGLIKNQNHNIGDQYENNTYQQQMTNGGGYSNGTGQRNAIYTARPVFMNGQSQRQPDSTDQNSMRRGSSTTANSSLSTWKVKKDSIPQTVHQYSIAKTLEDMHQRRFDSENGPDISNVRHQMVNGMLFDDRLDSDVARIIGLSLEDMKKMRFDIDLQDPQGILLQLQKRMQQPH